MHVQHRFVFRTALVVLGFVLALGCSRGKGDPFDPDTIKRDLEKRPIGMLYKEMEQQPWSPPEDGLLTDAHIADFLRVAALGEKIAEVAGERLDAEVEIAMQADDDMAKMASAFSAFGNARNAATAHIRAALLLGMNPNQSKWVTKQILAASWTVREKRTWEEKVANAEAARDGETNPVLREQRIAEVDQARSELRAWEITRGDVQLANARRIDQHAAELARYVKFLRRD